MDVATGVYDAVPQQAALPYVVIGDGSAQDVPQLQNAICECQLQLNVWTSGGGRKVALAMLNRLHGLLHHGTLSLTGMTLLSMRSVRAETVVDADNDRINGVMELQLLVRQDS
jgi:hypothetical protein